ncbi:hypothetical protein Patl1_03020 [Pistacia atlantica]|uniref:Uncharacterized protein n=1 Tax=Pistacia atlantica TaxID=434234 RepID=A0ACC1C7E0_9ROSI|nr:hypothetical protein Patl1_03020 [Pistacia atlantica]
MTQAKLTSLYGNITKANNGSYKSGLGSRSKSSEDCVIVEKACSNSNLSKGHGLSKFVNLEEEERGHRNTLGMKRAHVEISSPRNDSVKSPSSSEIVNNDASSNGFVTARTKLDGDEVKFSFIPDEGEPYHIIMCIPSSKHSIDSSVVGNGCKAKARAVSRRGVRGNFVPPIRSNGSNVGNMTSRAAGKNDDALDDSTKACLEMLCGPDGELPEKLRNLEPRLIEHVSNEIMDQDPNVRWDDIAGLEHAKKCVMEMVIWPLLRPDIFKGCRSPGKGLLLFGPPIGEGEKLVRALFGVASCRQPAVIFVDEIDSLLSQRKSEGEHESSRRLKTQFLIEMEGFDSGSEQILLIGATNRPQELDEAARRRLTKRLYIPLPSSGYSGSDMKNLVKDASMGPLREALRQGIEITKLQKEDLRPVTLPDFEYALQEVRPSVSLNELGTYEEWNKQFGSLSL